MTPPSPGKSASRLRGGFKREAPTPVDRLVRRIVREVSPDSGGTSDTRKVIFDREVDGVRCVLVRERSRSKRLRVQLSPRELEISRLVAKGCPSKTIARVLDISIWTVSTHLRRLFMKLGVSSRPAMVARLMEEGLFRD